MNFGEQLEAYIREKGLSINGVAKNTGINRGGLYNIFKGERILDEDRLSTVLQSIGASEEEEKVLNELYFSEVYGELEFSKIQKLSKLISDSSLDEPNYVIEPQEENCPNAVFGKVNITRAIENILVNSGSSKIITNYSYKDKEIDEVFYAFADSVEDKSSVIHILNFEKNRSDENIIEDVFASLKYMYIGCFPLCSSEVGANELFPFFVVTEDCSILFNESEAVTVSEASMNKKLFRKASRFVKKSTPLGKRCESLSDIIKIYARSFTAHKQEHNFLIEFCSYPCVSPFADYDLIASVARDDLPGREMLINIAVNHYKTMYENISHKLFYTTDGLAKLARTGNISEIPQSMVKTFEKNQRIEILKKIKAAVDDGMVYVLDESKFTLPQGMEFSIYFGKIIISEYGQHDERFFMGDRFISALNNFEIAHIAKELSEYLIRSKQYYPESYVKLFIDNLISKLENEKESDEIALR